MSDSAVKKSSGHAPSSSSSNASNPGSNPSNPGSNPSNPGLSTDPPEGSGATSRTDGELGDLANLLASAAQTLRMNQNKINLLTENKDLRRQLEKNKDTIKEKDRQLAELKGNLQNYEEDLRKTKEELKTAEETTKNARRQTEDTRISLMQETVKSQELVKQVEKERAQCKSIKTSFEGLILEMQVKIDEEKAALQTLKKNKLGWQTKSLLWMAVKRTYARILEQRQQNYEEGMKRVQEAEELNKKFSAERTAAVKRANEKEADLMMERDEFKKQKAGLVCQLSRSQALCTELENEVSSLKCINEAFRNKVQEMEDKSHQMQEENVSLKAAAHESERLTEEYKEEAQKMKMQMEVWDAQKTAATEHMLSMGQQCVTLQMQLTQAETTVEELRQMLEVKNYRVQQLQGLVDQMETQKSSLEDEARRTRLHVDNLENKVRVTEATVQILKETSATRQGELERSMQTITDNTATVKQLQDTSSQKEKEIRRYKLEVERLKQELRTAFKHKARVISGNFNETI